MIGIEFGLISDHHDDPVDIIASADWPAVPREGELVELMWYGVLTCFKVRRVLWQDQPQSQRVMCSVVLEKFDGRWDLT